MFNEVGQQYGCSPSERVRAYGVVLREQHAYCSAELRLCSLQLGETQNRIHCEAQRCDQPCPLAGVGCIALLGITQLLLKLNWTAMLVRYCAKV